MESVVFIDTEAGVDLVVSFALRAPDAPEEIESLTLLRTPKYEGLREESERGVRVFYERLGDEEAERLEEVAYREAECAVWLKTAAHTYALDVQGVGQDEIAAMRQVLRTMNRDGRVQMSGI